MLSRKLLSTVHPSEHIDTLPILVLENLGPQETPAGTPFPSAWLESEAGCFEPGLNMENIGSAELLIWLYWSKKARWAIGPLSLRKPGDFTMWHLRARNSNSNGHMDHSACRLHPVKGYCLTETSIHLQYNGECFVEGTLLL